MPKVIAEPLNRQSSSGNEEHMAWLEENAEAFEAQSEWHRKHGHPFRDIMFWFAAETWRE